MKLKDLCSFLDSVIPLSFQESYDNSGLQAGLPENEISSALLTLDVTEEVLTEAKLKGCNLIVSHHPLIFSGLKSITGKSITERVLMKALKQEIAIYSSHTNLDVYRDGVSRKMAEKLSLGNLSVLVPVKNSLLKLVTFVPDAHLDKVREALFSAGAGFTGNYDNCGFTAQGKGSFRGGEKTNPFAGEKGKIHFENETRFETVMFSHLRDSVVAALISSHPYEEVAYDIYSLENENTQMGLGCLGEFKDVMNEENFLEFVSAVFSAKGVRFSKLTGKKIKKVALCGGSGSGLIKYAIESGADAFVSADIKYHSFFDADSKLLIADIGHFESEKFATEILYDLIIKKFPKFAVRFSEVNTNPINYL